MRYKFFCLRTLYFEEFKFGITHIRTVYYFLNPKQGHMLMKYKWTYHDNEAEYLVSELLVSFEVSGTA